MSISSLGNFAAVQGLFKHAGVAIDTQSPRGVQVSADEAQKIATAFEAIPDAATKKVVGAELLKLIQADLFEVPSKTGQALIAKVVGHPTEQLFSARDKANLVGGNTAKTVAAASLSSRAKVPVLDKAQVDKLVAGLSGLGKEAQNVVHAAMNRTTKDGDVKFQPDARPVFTRAYAKAEASSEGAVSKMEETFSEKAQGSFEFFAAQMAASPYFEDRMAALMFTICAKTMKEVDRDLKNLDNVAKKDSSDRNNKPGKKGEVAAPVGAGVGAKGQIAPGPGVSGTEAQKLRTSMEAVVSSATSLRGNDGVITTDEAKALVGKLDKIAPEAARQLQAEAMGRAILAVGGGELTPEMQPLAAWVESTTGKKLTDIADAKMLYELKSPLAVAIGGSDKLENKVAAFIIDGALGESGGKQKLSAVMNEMKPLFSAMEREVTGTTVAAERAEAPKTSQHSTDIETRFSRIATAAKEGKIPVAQLTSAAKALVDRLPIGEDKKAIFDGVTAGLTALVGNKDVDIKSVFAKSVAPLVGSVTKQAPDHAALVGGAVDKARNTAAEAAFNTADLGKPLSKDEALKSLDGHFATARAELLKEAAGKGFDAPALEALGASFDHEAGAVRGETQKTGKITSTEPRGQGTDAVDPTATDESRSRQIMFETLKLKMTRLSEMMQAMSNILNAVHQTAENAIRAIR
jgi:hypothetical protein